MQRRYYPLVFIFSLAGLSLTSCLGEWWAPPSSAAEVLSFQARGQVGGAVINAASRSISLTLEPMDPADAAVSLTLSKGAECVPPLLKDGVSVLFTVTAEDGTQAAWTATATVQYGAAFTIDGIRRVLTAGLVDTTGIQTLHDGPFNDALDHRPLIHAYQGGTTLMRAYGVPTEFTAIMPTGEEALLIYIPDSPPFDANFDGSNANLMYYEAYDAGTLPPDEGNPWYAAAPLAAGLEATAASVSELSGGTDQGSVVRGRISGTVMFMQNDDPSGDLFPIADGYFKASFFIPPEMP
jgi:hypothetical protein